MIIPVFVPMYAQIQEAPRTHIIIRDPRAFEFEDRFDWSKNGPIDLIEELISRRRKGIQNFHIASYRKGWIKQEDIPRLRALVGSKEPCSELWYPISSHIGSHGTTVGAIAVEMIQAYESGGFPRWLKDLDER